MAGVRRVALLFSGVTAVLAGLGSVLTVPAHAARSWQHRAVPRGSTAGRQHRSVGARASINPTAAGDPLAGLRFFVDPGSAAAAAARQYPAVSAIAREPGTARFGSFSYPNAAVAVRTYLRGAASQEPGTVPMIATYRLVDGHCGNWADPVADQASYHSFISSFADGIGQHRAVLFLEMDALITVGCLTPYGVEIRMRELRDAIDVLTAKCPGLIVYLDAGAGDALPAWRAARLLTRAGIAKIAGFFLNSTHFDWTAHEVRYGEAVSRMTGGKHFVVNTGENGLGPLRPPNAQFQGNEVLCNPPGRGLGPLPTAYTGIPNVDAFAWTSNPGESGGACGSGAPPTGQYWPAYALMLVRNANFAVNVNAIARQARRIEAGATLGDRRRHHHHRHR